MNRSPLSTARPIRLLAAVGALALAAAGFAAPPSARTAAGASGSGPIRASHHYPRHTDIVATTFWVGELFDRSLADGSQVCSTYDRNWAFHWSGVNDGRVPHGAAGCARAIIGGCDGIPRSHHRCETERRKASNGFFPTHAEPRENPFYVDLPYDDVNDKIGFRKRCEVVPWAHRGRYRGHCDDRGFSYMKNRWVRILGPSGKACYGQIEDAGPSHGSLYHDRRYVFGAGDHRPAQDHFNNAGMDVSPALNGCLGFRSLDGDRDRVDWRFADRADVPRGPWRRIVTSSPVD